MEERHARWKIGDCYGWQCWDWCCDHNCSGERKKKKEPDRRERNQALCRLACRCCPCCSGEWYGRAASCAFSLPAASACCAFISCAELVRLDVHIYIVYSSSTDISRTDQTDRECYMICRKEWRGILYSVFSEFPGACGAVGTWARQSRTKIARNKRGNENLVACLLAFHPSFFPLSLLYAMCNNQQQTSSSSARPFL